MSLTIRASDSSHAILLNLAVCIDSRIGTDSGGNSIKNRFDEMCTENTTAIFCSFTMTGRSTFSSGTRIEDIWMVPHPLLIMSCCLIDDNPNYLNGIIIMIAKVLVVENTTLILVVRGSVILNITLILITQDTLLQSDSCVAI